MTETGKHKPLVKPPHDVLFRAIIDDKDRAAGYRWPDIVGMDGQILRNTQTTTGFGVRVV